jgi:hypothetical protein
VDTKRLVIGTVVGGITLHVVGYLIYELALAGFFDANVARDAQLMWAVALGNLALAALVTLAVGTRPGSATVIGGFRIGAIVGFLMWFGVDFIHYGITNIWNLTATIVDPLLEAIHVGIAGAVIAAVLGRIAESGPRETRST